MAAVSLPMFFYFYPRPPRGGRPVALTAISCAKISIHALREEGDALWAAALRHRPSISIHALREEGDHPPPCCRHRGR